ncbi:CorA family divalent cation transporter [Algoriphagus boritolerans]|uniref:CorA family divalent cation transporter n=1 Tax=Algoriphagus boritolerans TaxID=308111 RepID=UPI000ACF994C
MILWVKPTKIAAHLNGSISKSQKKKELLELTAPFHIEIKLLEDSLQHGHLPKIEKQDGTTFVIIRAYSADPSHNYSEVTKLTNKIAFVVSSDRLITIHKTL